MSLGIAFLKNLLLHFEKVSGQCAPEWPAPPHEMAGQAAFKSGIGWQVFLQFYRIGNFRLETMNSAELDGIPERELPSANFVSTVGYFAVVLLPTEPSLN